MAYDSNTIRSIYANLYEITNLNIIFHKYDSNKSFGGNTEYYPELIRNMELETIKQFTNKLLKASPYSVCYFENKLNLKYLATGFWTSGNYEATIVLGPYLNTNVTNELMHNVLTTNKLPISLRKILFEFYSSLPVLSLKKEQAIANIVANISNDNMKNSNTINIEENDYDFTSINHDYYNINLDISKIRARYDLEATLLHFVSNGDAENALKSLKGKGIFSLERFPESPLRNIKNFAIILSTNFRRTVQDQGVDVFYIHNISEKYAIIIEKSQSTTELHNVIIDMIKDYCNLIKQYSTSVYSALVSKAINYIRLNSSESLNLPDLAETLYVNPNYLSKKFKAETGKTVSAFINETRIHEAKYLLKNTNTTIADIAYMVGFNDKKYFSKVFKKYTGLTPSQYMNT